MQVAPECLWVGMRSIRVGGWVSMRQSHSCILEKGEIEWAGRVSVRLSGSKYLEHMMCLPLKRESMEG